MILVGSMIDLALMARNERLVTGLRAPIRDLPAPPRPASPNCRRRIQNAGSAKKRYRIRLYIQPSFIGSRACPEFKIISDKNDFELDLFACARSIRKTGSHFS
jgi:hypothetical protein